MYRPPSGNIREFLHTLGDILETANDKKYFRIYIIGDFNLELLNHRHTFFEFINLMFSFSLSPLITRPTRTADTTATLIDNIWASNIE